jgi:riboflavin kinase / FMN adenylyltransferase
MQILRHYAEVPEACRGSIAAIGNFDGVHLGHQALLDAARRRAHAEGTKLAMLTFEPHPRAVFRPEDPPFRLTPFRAKAHCVESLGVDILFALHFDLEFARISAEDFVTEILVSGLGIKGAAVGWDFVFGHKRAGNAALLREMGARFGFGVTEIGPVTHEGELYSSTRIRELLAAGDPRRAAVLLGRPWEIEGHVEHGDRRGRAIGFPTANLSLGDYLRPAAGVYAVRVSIENSESWIDGVANLGNRPTFAGTDLRLEIHLFDFAGDIYSRHLRVALIDHLRPERKFAGIDALKAQIAADCFRAREVLAGLL